MKTKMNHAKLIVFAVALAAPRGTRLVNLMYPLHIGHAGGRVTRLLQVIIGLIPALMFITGFLMWRNRVARRRASATK